MTQTPWLSGLRSVLITARGSAILTVATGLLVLPCISHAQGVARGRPETQAKAIAADTFSLSALPFDRALAKSNEQEKLLVVYATADDCAGSTVMLRSAGESVYLSRFYNEHAIVMTIDIDKDAALAAQLNIPRTPCILAFRGGQEFDRAQGLLIDSMVLEWLRDVNEGKAPAQPLDRYTDSLDARRGQAYRWMKRGRHAEALEEMLWVWNNVDRIESQNPSRLTRSEKSLLLPVFMHGLAREYPPAKRRFAAMRDELEAKLLARDSNANTLRDWAGLNHAALDDARTIAWFDRVKSETDTEKSIRSIWGLLGRALVQAKRYADYGKYAEIEEATQSAVSHVLFRGAETTEEDRPWILEEESRGRAELSTLFVSLLAANREDDARNSAAMAIAAIQDSACRRRFIALALDHGLASKELARYLVQADAQDQQPDATLRKRLLDAISLAKPVTPDGPKGP